MVVVGYNCVSLGDVSAILYSVFVKRPISFNRKGIPSEIRQAFRFEHIFSYDLTYVREWGLINQNDQETEALKVDPYWTRTHKQTSEYLCYPSTLPSIICRQATTIHTQHNTHLQTIYSFQLA